MKPFKHTPCKLPRPQEQTAYVDAETSPRTSSQTRKQPNGAQYFSFATPLTSGSAAHWIEGLSSSPSCKWEALDRIQHMRGCTLVPSRSNPSMPVSSSQRVTRTRELSHKCRNCIDLWPSKAFEQFKFCHSYLVTQGAKIQKCGKKRPTLMVEPHLLNAINSVLKPAWILKKEVWILYHHLGNHFIRSPIFLQKQTLGCTSISILLSQMLHWVLFRVLTTFSLEPSRGLRKLTKAPRLKPETEASTLSALQGQTQRSLVLERSAL